MPTPTAIDPISASLRLIIERMHKHVGDRLYDLRSEAEAVLPIACIGAPTPAKPAKLLAIIAWAVLGLSDSDRRLVELHLAVARLSPERRGRLLDCFDGSLDALADDLQAYMQGADVPVGSPEDVLLAASHVTAYVETDEARFGADGKPSDSDELWDRNGAPYALDERGNPIHDAAMDYLAPPRTADGQVPTVTPAWSVEMSAGPAAVPICPVCGLDEASPECFCESLQPRSEDITVDALRAALHGMSVEMSADSAVVDKPPSRNEFAAMVIAAMPETWHFGELTALGARGPDGVQYGGEFDVVLVTAFIDGGDEARLEVTWDRETQRLCLVEVDHGGETMGETTSFAQVRAADLPMRLSELLAAHSADFDANDDDRGDDDDDRGDDYGASEASSL